MNGRTVEENITDMIGKTGEKLDLSVYEVVAGAAAFAYIHPGNRITSIAAFNKVADGVEQAGKRRGDADRCHGACSHRQG
jgi:translation elongation factor EF-Ts